MFKSIKKILACLIVFSFLVPPGSGSAYAMASSDALVGLAVSYYKQGYYNEALHEFSKALLIEPDNEQARQYIRQIRAKQAASKMMSKQETVTSVLDEFEQNSKTPSQERQVIINRELDQRSASKQLQKSILLEKQKKIKKEKTGDYVDIKGEVQIAGGVTSSGGAIWKEANGDLNERNFRILFSTARANTYDPAIYDRLRLNIDTKNLDEIGLDHLNAHLNLTIDPWSFTGKTDNFTLSQTGIGTEQAEFQLKYWSNTGHTINEITNTLVNGAGVALPEIKVIDGMTVPTSVKSTFGANFNIPAQKVQMNFMPVRELWFDYKDDTTKIRFFPMAYQDQALTSGDPLALSNHHTWWEESPWLADWKPGQLNVGATPDDFTKGKWDDTLAFFTRDSDNLRLTALRGASFSYLGADSTLQSTIASPKNLWADYDNFDTVAESTRYTHDLLYNMGIGFTHAGHFGFNEGSLDGLNNVFSTDAKFEPFLGTKISGQVAGSESSFDRTDDVYHSRKSGYAYLVSLENRLPGDELYNKDFNAIRKNVGEDGFLKSRWRAVHMDSGFESSLASYGQTRDDEFWSRHITFRKHPLYFYTGLSSPMKFDDILPFAIGDGIDAGRNVIGWRLEGATKLFDRNFDGLFDVRNVHNVNGGYIENVSRLDLTYDVTDKLTTRLMGIRQDMPETQRGIDPFLVDSTTGKSLLNTAIKGGEDPSLGTLSAGFDYKLTEKFSFNSVWEYTNDSTVATGDFPRGLFSDSNFTTFVENGKVYRQPVSFVYDQAAFPLPPYDYFNIYKFGFSYRPIDVLEFYLDFAFNENKKSGQIDDNMNHYGLEIAYEPIRKLSFLFKYTHSRWLDTDKVLGTAGNEVAYQWHNNFFIDTRYHIDIDSDFILEYGVGGMTPLGTVTSDPFGGALAVLDTQHIVRLFYKKRF